jgi:predicted nucleotide-binding protein
MASTCRKPRNSPDERRPPTVLWADDDQLNNEPAVEALEYEGFKVLTAASGSAVLSQLAQHWPNVHVLVLDIKMPPGSKLRGRDTLNGHRTGLVLAKLLRERYPQLPVVGLSFVRDPEVEAWFKLQGAPYISKTAPMKDIIRTIGSVAHARPVRRPPKCFIVHGHDHAALCELQDYLEHTLNFPRPVVLAEHPSAGRTIIEKLEEESESVDLVFVLLTADDRMAATSRGVRGCFRARQNVIFELGYFYAKLHRRQGRVIILHKAEAELPSDIHGVACIDISNGIARADRQIRQELREWLPKARARAPNQMMETS